jgi:hypothetical protein
MRELLVLLSGVLVAGALTVGVRLANTPQEVHDEAPEVRRVRVKPVRPAPATCPEDEETRRLLAEVQQETQLVEREADSLERRREMLGAALPDELPAHVRPAAVTATVQALLPSGAQVVWSCETVPCSGAVALEPEQVQPLQEALEAEYPGSTQPHEIDGHTVLFFSVDPGLTEREHRARLYFLGRHNRGMVQEELRELLSR